VSGRKMSKHKSLVAVHRYSYGVVAASDVA
jgi:hypothetical protein